MDLQETREKDDRWYQLLIYPEGTQTNGTHLIPFKRGAFQAMKPVVPVVLQYAGPSEKSFKLQWDVLDFLPHAILTYSLPGMYTCTVLALPPFNPT